MVTTHEYMDLYFARPFGRISVLPIFGSAEIDLRNAKLAGGQATLVLSAVFGGIEVAVPREWEVVLEGSPVLGSIESRKTAASEGAKTGTLHVKGSAVFGSIEIKD
jgi:predicted membrane protein